MVEEMCNLKKTIIILLIFNFLTLLSWSAPSISLKITGKWTLTLRATDLIGGAGTDYLSEQESAVDQISITISKTATPTTPWRMDIKRVDINWNPNLHLYGRRTADGTGTGTINGGTVYQEITLTDQEFFTGTGERSKIEVQLKLSGISVFNLVEDTFDTTLYYTVTEL